MLRQAAPATFTIDATMSPAGVAAQVGEVQALDGLNGAFRIRQPGVFYTLTSVPSRLEVGEQSLTLVCNNQAAANHDFIASERCNCLCCNVGLRTYSRK